MVVAELFPTAIDEVAAEVEEKEPLGSLEFSRLWFYYLLFDSLSLLLVVCVFDVLVNLLLWVLIELVESGNYRAEAAVFFTSLLSLVAEEPVDFIDKLTFSSDLFLVLLFDFLSFLLFFTQVDLLVMPLLLFLVPLPTLLLLLLFLQRSTSKSFFVLVAKFTETLSESCIVVTPLELVSASAMTDLL